jgi:hypothetical protein
MIGNKDFDTQEEIRDMLYKMDEQELPKKNKNTKKAIKKGIIQTSTNIEYER